MPASAVRDLHQVQLQEAAGCPAADWQMGRMEPPMVEDERKEGRPVETLRRSTWGFPHLERCSGVASNP